jgi:predicted P-loop ATPase
MTAATQSAPRLIPDLEQAARFLKALDPDATAWTFQTFSDRKDGSKGNVLHGTLNEHAKKLIEVQEQGHGVFITVNETNFKGRKEGNITRVRAVFADFDQGSMDRAALDERLSSLPLTPHIITESSAGKWHVYFRTLGVPLDRFEAIQKRLIRLWGTDKTVHDLPRVMRLPGFFHQKPGAGAWMTRIEELNEGPCYGLSDLAPLTAGAAAPEDARKGDSEAQEQPDAPNVSRLPSMEDRARATRMAEDKAAYSRAHPETARHGLVLQLGYDLVAAGIPRAAAREAARVFAANCRPTNVKGEAEQYGEKRAVEAVTNAYGPKKTVNPRPNEGNKPPTSNLAGAMDALRSDPQLTDLVGYDEMLRDDMLLKPVPGVSGRWSGVRSFGNNDVSAVQLYMQKHGLSRMGYDTVDRAIKMRAQEKAYHPVRDWLESLQWDGTERLGHWLPRYCNTEDSDYTRAVGRMFLISMVARIFQPGCKVDHVLILGGPTGFYKSTACKILAGGEAYFSDDLPDMDAKDARAHLNGKWLVELSELTAVSKAEVETIKAFVTRQVETYRPAYGRRDVHEPRQCVFVGTTNQDEYLRDETGNRRFWPVDILNRIDLARLEQDRSQLFAEAVAAYNSGERWYPDAEQEERIFRPRQAAKMVEDVWTETVSQWLADRFHEKNVTTVSIGDALSMAVGLSVEKQNRAVQNRMTSILTQLGWKRREKRGTGGIKLWEAGPTWQPAEKRDPREVARRQEEQAEQQLRREGISGAF